MIENGRGGKRIWVEDTKRGYGYDYSQTVRTSYPEWSQFYFVNTPKRLRHLYSQHPCWKDGYYNGSKKDYLRLFDNMLKGKLPRSERMISVLDITMSGYFDSLFEDEGMDYHFDGILERIPF